LGGWAALDEPPGMAPPDDRLSRTVCHSITNFGVAAVRPAEFIVLQFTHKMQQA